MATIEKRDLHLVKEALAIAALVIERQKGPMQASNDALDMKLLLEGLSSQAEVEHYSRMAWTAVHGTTPPRRS